MIEGQLQACQGVHGKCQSDLTYQFIGVGAMRVRAVAGTQWLARAFLIAFLPRLLLATTISSWRESGKLMRKVWGWASVA
jgi:hypothetical protein